LGARSGNHIQSSFSHIGMRVKLLFTWSIENTLHRRDVDHPGWSGSRHFVLELADEVERNHWVDNLGCIAVKQGYIFYFLNPCINFSLIQRLSKLITGNQINFLRFNYNLIGVYTRVYLLKINSISFLDLVLSNLIRKLQS